LEPLAERLFRYKAVKNRADARFFIARSHTKLVGNRLYLSQLLGY
jgi:hypothetical protein